MTLTLGASVVSTVVSGAPVRSGRVDSEESEPDAQAASPRRAINGIRSLFMGWKLAHVDHLVKFGLERRNRTAVADVQSIDGIPTTHLQMKPQYHRY